MLQTFAKPLRTDGGLPLIEYYAAHCICVAVSEPSARSLLNGKEAAFVEESRFEQNKPRADRLIFTVAFAPDPL